MNFRPLFVAVAIVAGAPMNWVHATSYLYYTVDANNSSSIYRSNLDGSNAVQLDVGTGRGGGFEVDVANGYLYRLTATGIRRTELDGSNPLDMPAPTNGGSGAGFGGDLALDLMHGKMYWSTFDVIRRANLDGTNVEPVITTPFGGQINGIALDVAGGRMYFVDSQGNPGGDKLHVANLDGSNLATHVTLAASADALDIDIDPHNGLVYWNENADFSLAKQAIRRTTLASGGAVETVFQPAAMNQRLHAGLDYDPRSGAIYFASFGQQVTDVARINADGSDFQAIPSPNEVAYVRAIHTDVLLDFDDFNAAAAHVVGQPVADYFSDQGVTVTGDDLAVFDVRNFTDQGVEFTVPASRTNFLGGSRSPQNNVWTFPTPMTEVSFVRNGLITTGPGGTTHPEWSAVARDASGAVLGTVGEPLIATFGNVPPTTFTLTGAPGQPIKSIEWHSDHHDFAGYGAVILDDVLLTPAPLVRGDYDRDGLVDGVDFLVWQRNLGSTTDLLADGSGNYVVDMTDLQVWRSHFGNNSEPAANTVPEPATALLLAWGVVGWAGTRRLRACLSLPART